jgi:amino acid permease
MGCAISFLRSQMKHRRRLPIGVVVFVLLFLCIATPAYAYIDPNAAGLISQILTPVIVAVGAGLTFFRKQLGALYSTVVRRLRRSEDV